MATPQSRSPLPSAAAAFLALSASASVMAQATQATQGTDTTLPTINVKDSAERSTNNGYQGGTTTIGKLKQLPKDVPQALTVVPEQLMQDTGANTLKDALRNVAGLTFNAGEGGRIGDNINLRGFYSFGDLYLDGIRDTAQYNRETFNLGQIDVLRGSGSMLFGRGQAGGVINQVSKAPILVDKNEASATLGSYSYKRVTADINRKLGDDVAARLTVMKTDAGSSRNAVTSEREGYAPTVRWGIGSDNEFSLGLYALYTRNVPDYGVPFGPNQRPIDVPANRFYGTAKDFEENDTKMVTGSYKHKFSNVSELKTVLRAADYKRDLWAVAPSLRVSANPDPCTGTRVMPATVSDASVVCRGRQARGAEEHTLTSQTDFTTQFDTGSLHHEALAGVELLHEKAGRWSYTSNAAAIAPNTTVGVPDPNASLPASYGNRIRTAVNTYHGMSKGFYAQDTIGLAPSWKLLIGARRDQMNALYSNGATVDYGQWSYRSGLSFQPTDESHYYAAMSSSFNPTSDLYQFSPAGTTLEPERSKVFEIGAKWELFEGNLSLRTALYRAEKFWERNTDAESAAGNALLSKRRHTDGFELEGAGRITPRWEIFAGLALMKARIDEAAFVTSTGAAQSPDLVGMRPRNAPPWTWNVWTTYKLSEEWKIGGGIDAKGDRLAYGIGTASPTVNIAPAYYRTDAMVEYTQGAYSVRLNVLNLFDKRYYESVYENGGFAVPGTERALQLTLTFKN